MKRRGTRLNRKKNSLTKTLAQESKTPSHRETWMEVVQINLTTNKKGTNVRTGAPLLLVNY